MTKVRKVRQRIFFISVSNARTNKYYILRRCMYLVYLLFKRTESLCWREITVTQGNNIIFPRIDRPIQVPSFTVILFSTQQCFSYILDENNITVKDGT
jgi:hypothetical protein